MNVIRRPAVWALGLGLAAALSACSAAASPGGPAGPGGGGSCTEPVLNTVPNTSVEPTVTVSPGQALRIYGFGYQTCHDTSQQPPATPLAGLRVSVSQGQSQQVLATVSAGPDGDFAVTVRLPADLRPGPAMLRTSEQTEVHVHLKVR